jgi:hypothetical protein
MELTALRGELRAAGRWAATLSHVELRILAGDAFSATGRIADLDSYWLETDGPFDLALNVGPRTWRWRRVTLTRVERSFRATGIGRPEIT